MSKKKEKEKIDWKVICFGLGCITILEVVALLKGYNGTILAMVIAIIALAIGLNIEKPDFLKGGGR